MTAAHCTESLRSRQAIITMGHRSSSLRRAKNERFTQVREVEAIIEHFGKIVLLQMHTRQKKFECFLQIDDEAPKLTDWFV